MERAQRFLCGFAAGRFRFAISGVSRVAALAPSIWLGVFRSFVALAPCASVGGQISSAFPVLFVRLRWRGSSRALRAAHANHIFLVVFVNFKFSMKLKAQIGSFCMFM